MPNSKDENNKIGERKKLIINKFKMYLLSLVTRSIALNQRINESNKKRITNYNDRCITQIARQLFAYRNFSANQ